MVHKQVPSTALLNSGFCAILSFRRAPCPAWGGLLRPRTGGAVLRTRGPLRRSLESVCRSSLPSGAVQGEVLPVLCCLAWFLPIFNSIHSPPGASRAPLEPLSLLCSLEMPFTSPHGVPDARRSLPFVARCPLSGELMFSYILSFLLFSSCFRWVVKSIPMMPSWLKALYSVKHCNFFISVTCFMKAFLVVRLNPSTAVCGRGGEERTLSPRPLPRPCSRLTWDPRTLRLGLALGAHGWGCAHLPLPTGPSGEALCCRADAAACVGLREGSGLASTSCLIGWAHLSDRSAVTD